MQRLKRNKNIESFVKEIFLFENDNNAIKSSLPFYADGFPGIMYSETNHGVFLQPGNRELSEFFLYGQTIEPIELFIKGSFKLIIFQLYPFAVRLLLGINPKELNDDCYDLLQLDNINTQHTLDKLIKTRETSLQVDLITLFLNELVKISSANADYRIKLAVNLIISSKGNITIKKVRDNLYIAERTFERHFTKEIGVTPKQFAKIIQFNFSLNQLSERDYLSLTEISYSSGFSDQSHFIRTFKRFVGKTPKEIQEQISI